MVEDAGRLHDAICGIAGCCFLVFNHISPHVGPARPLNRNRTANLPFTSRSGCGRASDRALASLLVAYCGLHGISPRHACISNRAHAVITRKEILPRISASPLDAPLLPYIHDPRHVAFRVPGYLWRTLYPPTHPTYTKSQGVSDVKRNKIKRSSDLPTSTPASLDARPSHRAGSRSEERLAPSESPRSRSCTSILGARQISQRALCASLHLW